MEKRRFYTPLGTILLGAAFLILSPHDPASSDDKRYKNYGSRHDKVYKYRRSRNILSFEKILKLARPHIKGEIIEIEFEYEDGIPAYEFKYIDPQGRVMEMYVDARNGKILKHEMDD